MKIQPINLKYAIGRTGTKRESDRKMIKKKEKKREKKEEKRTRTLTTHSKIKRCETDVKEER
jgi:hypothetical protein